MARFYRTRPSELLNLPLDEFRFDYVSMVLYMQEQERQMEQERQQHVGRGGGRRTILEHTYEEPS